MSPAATHYPTRLSTVEVPITDRRAAVAAMGLYAPCKTLATVGHRAAMALVATAGTRILPGTRADWSAPLDLGLWNALETAWRGDIGRYEHVAVARPRQSERHGAIVLLLRDGMAVACVKVRRGANALDVERRIATSLADDPPETFRAPIPLAWGTVRHNEGDGSSTTWSWLAFAPIPRGAHAPGWRAPVNEIASEASAALTDALPRSVIAPGWVAMHGDFGPWNLRRSHRQPWLLDWEQAGWGPPGADAVFWAAADAAIRGRRVRTTAPDAASFWLDRIAHRHATGGDAKLRDGMVRALVTMGGVVDLAATPPEAALVRSPTVNEA